MSHGVCMRPLISLALSLTVLPCALHAQNTPTLEVHFPEAKEILVEPFDPRRHNLPPLVFEEGELAAN